MKKYVIAGIALSISSIFIFAPIVNSPKTNNPKNTAIVSDVKELIVISPVNIESKPITESVTDTITYPTFDDLQMKYIQIRKSSDLYMIFIQQRSLYPDRFAPENIESSFEYINNYFNQSKQDYNFAELKQSFTWSN